MAIPLCESSRQEQIEECLARLERIDFSNVRMKLLKPDAGWNDERTRIVEREYKRFLALNFAYPEHKIVPNADVDHFWHQHILDTRAYAKDSVIVFGYFFHHFPYLGLRGPEDHDRLLRHHAESIDLYHVHFGAARQELVPASSCSDCSSCSNG